MPFSLMDIPSSRTAVATQKDCLKRKTKQTKKTLNYSDQTVRFHLQLLNNNYRRLTF